MTKKEESPLEYDWELTRKIGTTLGAISLLGTVASTSPTDTKTPAPNERTATTITTDLSPRTTQPTQPNPDKKTTQYRETINEERRRERLPSGQRVG
jgi:hypothetical protein